MSPLEGVGVVVFLHGIRFSFIFIFDEATLACGNKTQLPDEI